MMPFSENNYALDIPPSQISLKIKKIISLLFISKHKCFDHLVYGQLKLQFKAKYCSTLFEKCSQTICNIDPNAHS